MVPVRTLAVRAIVGLLLTASITPAADPVWPPILAPISPPDQRPVFTPNSSSERPSPLAPIAPPDRLPIAVTNSAPMPPDRAPEVVLIRSSVEPQVPATMPNRVPEVVLVRLQPKAPPPSSDSGATTGAPPPPSSAPVSADTGATTGAPPPPSTSAVSQGTPAPPNVGTNTNTTVSNAAPAGTTTSAINGSAGQAGQALAAPDVSDLLSKSSASTGVEVQRRNAVIGDPRIRGWRTGQYAVYGDGGEFSPARLDLDTAVSKFDATSLRDVVVVKGPYSVLYGPAFSVLSVNSLDAPRYDQLEVHGRTSLGYQTNGQRWDGLQSVSVGDGMWGFRATYNILQGNNYQAGDGTTVPGSYLSNNINFAFGINLTQNSTLELKGLRVLQQNLEFPGLYFDVRNLDTSALSLKYTLDDMGLFDRFTLTTWYNSTAGSGDTQGAAKQSFVQQLLFQSFNPQFAAGYPIAQAATNPTVALFRDLSTTQFAERSIGYRAAMSWGPKDDPWVILGTDLKVDGQALVENIRIQQLQGPNVDTGLPVQAGAQPTFTQNQSIPPSNLVDPGLFLQGRIPVTDDLTIRGGSRVDWVRTSSDPRLITGNINLFGPVAAPGSTVNPFLVDPIVYSSNPNNTALTREFPLFAGFLQSEYRLDEHLTGMAAVGHSERAPTLTELYASGPFIGVLQQGTSRLIGDPNLAPEKLTEFDLGLRLDYGFLQAGVNGYYAWVNNYITYDANKTGTGLTQVVYTNTNLATLAGGELFLQLDLTAWVTPFATLSYVQGIDQTARDNRQSSLASSRIDNPIAGVRVPETEPLPQMPPLESRLGFRVHTPTTSPWWQVELSARMVAGQNNVATSLGEVPTPGFTVFTVRGFVKLRDQWLLTAGVDNLGNKTYREHLDPIAGNLLGVGPLYRPGTSFNFGIQWSY